VSGADTPSQSNVVMMTHHTWAQLASTNLGKIGPPTRKHKTRRKNTRSDFIFTCTDRY